MSDTNQQRKPLADLQAKFTDLVNQPPEEQLELFLKSMIFALGDDWKKANALLGAYKKYLVEHRDPGHDDLNCVQAANFLQLNGRERTALQRKEEIKDIDLDFNDRICFIEYLLLHYKDILLTEFYKRTGESHSFDLSNGAIGVTGVGHQLLDELFFIPTGIDPELQRAIEELTAAKKKRADELKALEDESKTGGVKGGIAAAKLAQELLVENPELIKAEAKINSALRKSKGKESGDIALKKKQETQRKEEEAKKNASRQALQARIANMGLQ